MQASCKMYGRSEDMPVRLMALWWMILQVTSTSFGGFMAMISSVQHVIVERHKLLADEEVIEGVSLASMLPGPTAINVVAFIGYRLRGIAGAAVCVVAAVLPAFLLMLVLSVAYFRWGQVPAVGKAFMAVVPVVAAIVAAAAWRMCRTAVTTWREAVLALGAVAIMLGFPGIHATLGALCVAAGMGRFWFGQRMADRPPAASPQKDSGTHPLLRANAPILVFAALPVLSTPAPGAAPESLLTLTGAFAGLGMLMFGGGYVFIPLLQHAVVDSHGWVTSQEFVDAIALGQVTPGPVMISATFIGYKVAGMAGAVAATVGMFAPPAVLMVLFAHLLGRIKASANVQAALRGMRAATVGMVAAAAMAIGGSAMPNFISAILFAVALVLLLRSRVETGALVLASGLVGLVIY